MTVPIDFKTATSDFDKFLLDARETCGLTTTNQVWGVLLGVFDVFRRRLTPDETLLFAKALPPLLRAALIETWHPTEPIPFVEREALNREVQAYHADHQFASEHAIDEIASVVWRHVDQPRLQRALDHLPAQAAAFWNRSRPTKSSEASQ
jgi:uncharacterized protein (DUF2267 family)